MYKRQAEDVIEAHKNGVQDILLVRLETSPEDIEEMCIRDRMKDYPLMQPKTVSALRLNIPISH